MTHHQPPLALLLVLGLGLAFVTSRSAHAQDTEATERTDTGDDTPETPPAVEPPAAPPRFAFAPSLEAARESAKSERKPLLVVAVPDWYESPGWTRLEKLFDADGDAAEKLAGFAGTVIDESRDREVHVRHRLRVQGYPLVVVLDADGAYLGHTSGTPAEGDETAWIERIAAIPPRAAKIAALRTRLDTAPEDPALLFELGRLLAEAGENDRANALFARMEQAEPLGPAERIGEARYLTLRHRIVGLLHQRKFADVEALCLRWRRRFAKHERIDEVLLLQANARFLAGNADDARELWQSLVDEHGDTDAAKTAARSLKSLAD